MGTGAKGARDGEPGSEGPLIMSDTMQAQGGGQRRCAFAVHRDFTRPGTISLFAGSPLYAGCRESDRYGAHWRPEDVEVSPGERGCVWRGVWPSVQRDAEKIAHV